MGYVSPAYPVVSFVLQLLLPSSLVSLLEMVHQRSGEVTLKALVYVMQKRGQGGERAVGLSVVELVALERETWEHHLALPPFEAWMYSIPSLTTDRKLRAPTRRGAGGKIKG